MSQSFNCPNCGAPLDYTEGSAPTIRCPFCNNSVIVPEELRDHAASSDGMVDLQPGKLKDIADLARGGNKIAAIKLYREMFGVGLQEAKNAIDSLAEGRPVQIHRVAAERAAKVAAAGSSKVGRWIGCGIVAFIVLMIVVALLPVVVTPAAMFFAFNSAPSVAPIRATAAPSATRVPSPTPTPGFASAVAQFGGKGTGAGLFNDARSIALDGAGNIYVGDYEGGRVQVFDANGKYTTQWRVGNSKTIISNMAADRKGMVLVVADGQVLRIEGATGKSLGSLEYPGGNKFDSIAMMTDGGVLAMWYEEQFGMITSIQGHRDDLVRFDATGKVTNVIRGIISNQTGDPELETHLAVDGLGTIYALGGEFEPSVFKFTPEGKFVNKFGSRGSEPGQFSSPRAIAVDNQSRVYVADSQGIQVFDSNGRFLDLFKSGVFPSAMVFNDKNELFTVSNTQVVEFVVNQ